MHAQRTIVARALTANSIADAGDTGRILELIAGCRDSIGDRRN